MEGPRTDFLAALVLDAAEGEQFGAGCQARLFRKFALGGGEFVFAGIDFALGHEPCAGIFVGPERSAQMDEQDL